MEVKSRHSHHGTNGILIAILFIAVGFVLIGRNLGFIDYSISRILISWQMLLIVLGLVTLLKRQYIGGAILLGVGLFFLTPHIPGVGHFWMANYWPLVFVGVGILMILRRNDRGEYFHHRWVRDHEASSYNSTDGFVTSNNSFGSVHQIVVDPVFKGAVISNSFGSTVLDLRRTSLEQKETYIDVDSSFGGIEIFVPESWTVKSIVKNSFSGFVDKRYNTMVMDNTKIILIRGSISFSGLEVKS